MSPQSADESSNTPKHDTVPKPSRSMPQIASKSGSRAPLAQSLPAGGVGDRDRAANGPLRSPIHSGCSGSGGKGLVDGPEPSKNGLCACGRRERVSSSSSPSRTPSYSPDLVAHTRITTRAVGGRSTGRRHPGGSTASGVFSESSLSSAIRPEPSSVPSLRASCPRGHGGWARESGCASGSADRTGPSSPSASRCPQALRPPARGAFVRQNGSSSGPQNQRQT